jgi:Protein of unknown function (DUF4232)
MTAPAPPAPRTAARAVLAGAGLACIAALAAACGTSSQPAASTTVTVTASPTSAASTGPASTAPAVATPPSPPSPPPAGAAACPTRSLQVKPGVAQGTAGSVYTALDFVNISNVTCTLYGYPGVSLASGQPVTQIGLAAAEDHAHARELVTLAPHAVANALLRIVDAGNFPPAKCHPTPATFLQVFPPNQTTPIYVGYTAQACSKPVLLLTVGVVQPGSGSSS